MTGGVKNAMTKQLYVIRKYIMAKSAQEAIRKDKTTKVQDCWIDEDWRKNNLTIVTGFKK